MYPLEGYLYPETYFVTERRSDASRKSPTMMLDHTDKVLTKRKSDIEKVDMTVHQFLTLSSVVERRISLQEEIARKSPVSLSTVLNKNMPLQQRHHRAATLCRRQRCSGDAIKDLQVDSKYNTYKNTGLPVGPVCSPSADSHG